MREETLKTVAGILGNGYTCFVNKQTEEVFSAENISLADSHEWSIPLSCFLDFKLYNSERFNVQNRIKINEFCLRID